MPELHEIILQVKQDQVKAAALEYKASIQKMMEEEKRLTAFSRTENQVRVQENKVRLQKELADFNAAMHQRQQQESKFRGQSVALGSPESIRQMRSYMSTLSMTSPEYVKMKTHIESLASTHKQSLISMITDFRNLTIAGLGLSQLLRFTIQSVKEFAKEETSVRVLGFAVEKVTGQTQELTRSLEEFASQMEANYNIQDNVIRQQEAFLVMQGLTEEQIKQLITASIDLAAIQGDLSDENVQANVQKLAGTYEGVLGKLAKYDERLKGLSKTQLANGEAVTILAEKYKGTAEEFNKGIEGNIRRLNTFWENLKEFVGWAATTWYGATEFGEQWGEVFTNLHFQLKDFWKDLLNMQSDFQKASRDFSGLSIKYTDEQIRNYIADYKGSLSELSKDMSTYLNVPLDQVNQILKSYVSTAKDIKGEGGLLEKTITGSKGYKQTIKEIEEIKTAVQEISAKAFFPPGGAPGPAKGERTLFGEKMQPIFTKEAVEDFDTMREDMEAIAELAGQFQGKMGETGDKLIAAFQIIINTLSKVLTLQGKEGGAGFADFLGIFGSLIPLFFLEKGGPTGANKPYIVGEKGPELFVPDRSGLVLPNWMTKIIEGHPTHDHRLALGGRVSGGMNIYFNGRLLDDNLKREIASRGMYLENLQIERSSP